MERPEPESMGTTSVSKDQVPLGSPGAGTLRGPVERVAQGPRGPGLIDDQTGGTGIWGSSVHYSCWPRLQVAGRRSAEVCLGLSRYAETGPRWGWQLSPSHRGQSDSMPWLARSTHKPGTHHPMKTITIYFFNSQYYIRLFPLCFAVESGRRSK